MAVSSYDLNSEFWIRIIREDLDRYRTELTNEAVLDAVGACAGKRLLDAGCGEGYLSRMFAQLGAQVDGIDSSAALITAARDAASPEGHKINFSRGDVTRMNFAGETFDIVVCNHLLNDLAEPVLAIEEFNRVLRRNGNLVILMLHPCFVGFHVYDERDGTCSPVSNYFSARQAKQVFDVAGILSPAPVSVYARPLEYYIGTLISAGFRITSLREPHPSPEKMDDEWWKQNFSVPVLLLITAAKEEGSPP